MHLGLIVIGIKGLLRKHLGSKVLLTIYDERIQNIEKSMIASTEVDMNDNNGIIYCNPDFLLTIKDFSEKIKIGIQTHGYEDVVSGENLLISIDKVINLMSSKGIKMIKPKTYDSELLAGLEWNLENFLENQEPILVPQEAITYKDLYGRTSLRYGNYSHINRNNDSETESNNEDQGEEYINKVEIEIEDRIIYPKELGKIAGPLYGKTSPKGQRYFNIEDVKLVQKIKEKLKDLPKLSMPLETDYLIIETDDSITGWGAILIAKPNKYSDKDTEKIVRYNSGKIAGPLYGKTSPKGQRYFNIEDVKLVQKIKENLQNYHSAVSDLLYYM